jgi:hypothetical protein
MGQRPGQGYSLERVNNAGNYEPGNVIWATAQMQANNTRHNRQVTIGSKTQTLAQWARELNLSPRTLSSRISAGWSDKEITTIPLHKRRNSKGIKITPHTATQIDTMRAEGISITKIAKETKMSSSNVHLYLKGKARIKPSSCSPAYTPISRAGSNNAHAKLTEETVHKIWKLRNEGLSARKISNALSLPIGTISNIIYRHNWTHVTEHRQ